MAKNNLKKIIKYLLAIEPKSERDLTSAKRLVAKKFKIGILTNAQILKAIKEAKLKIKPDLLRLFRKRAVRTLSGIAPVAVLTKPYPCPGKCAYCPTEKNVPQSYLSNEPAVMRAIRCHYNPYVQVQDRLKALEANGHKPTKIELIVIGGTWSYLPKKYKYWYITECFRAANDYPATRAHAPVRTRFIASENATNAINARTRFIASGSDEKTIASVATRHGASLSDEQHRNESAKYQIIGLTLETRPDYINEKELWEMRELGATRVELGVQALDDKILKLNKRGHGVKEIADATKLLKDFGFKVTYHFMPGLPGSTPAKDLKMFKQLFSDERFQPDQIKFYPTVVTKGSLLYRWWKQGKYKPYSDKALQNLIIECKKVVPPYVRIIRLIRDIPAESIEAGNIITNLRQIMKNQGVECKCIRCREARSLPVSYCLLSVVSYKASGGKEYFISFESKDKKILYGFCRLRLAKEALIRELHVYGELVSIGTKKKIQHSGLGKKLLAEAEKIAKKNGYAKITVISGIGVRNYYRKLGYKLEKTYLVKKLK